MLYDLGLVIPKAKNCRQHEWHNAGDQRDACYHCSVVRHTPQDAPWYQPPDGYPRELDERERATLDFVLSVDDPRVEPLRAQTTSALVRSMCPCGCATIDLQVDRSLAIPAPLGSPAIEAYKQGMMDGRTDDDPYSLLLFLDRGWLSSLELVWYGDKPIPTFPAIASFDPPEIDALSQHDESLDRVQQWFGERGYNLLMGRSGRTFLANLHDGKGRLKTAAYGTGLSPAKAASQAMERAMASRDIGRR